VKDHAFLIHACQRLKENGLEFLCLIAGEGPEQANLERLIDDFDLLECVRLLGHLNHSHLLGFYEIADVVVLTSRSEGIPLTLMEAMAYAKPVIAPAITGIPELVADGKTGFLYPPGNLEEFVSDVEIVASARTALNPIGRAARRHVLAHFDREKNVAQFADRLLSRIGKEEEYPVYENPVLQQI
jgi:glycosyltransferase involved in cell wall biosynthesis